MHGWSNRLDTCLTLHWLVFLRSRWDFLRAWVAWNSFWLIPVGQCRNLFGRCHNVSDRCASAANVSQFKQKTLDMVLQRVRSLNRPVLSQLPRKRPHVANVLRTFVWIKCKTSRTGNLETVYGIYHQAPKMSFAGTSKPFRTKIRSQEPHNMPLWEIQKLRENLKMRHGQPTCLQKCQVLSENLKARIFDRSFMWFPTAITFDISFIGLSSIAKYIRS